MRAAYGERVRSKSRYEQGRCAVKKRVVEEFAGEGKADPLLVTGLFKELEAGDRS